MIYTFKKFEYVLMELYSYTHTQGHTHTWAHLCRPAERQLKPPFWWTLRHMAEGCARLKCITPTHRSDRAELIQKASTASTHNRCPIPSLPRLAFEFYPHRPASRTPSSPTFLYFFGYLEYMKQCQHFRTKHTHTPNKYTLLKHIKNANISTVPRHWSHLFSWKRKVNNLEKHFSEQSGE